MWPFIIYVVMKKNICLFVGQVFLRPWRVFLRFYLYIIMNPWPLKEWMMNPWKFHNSLTVNASSKNFYTNIRCIAKYIDELHVYSSKISDPFQIIIRTVNVFYTLNYIVYNKRNYNKNDSVIHTHRNICKKWLVLEYTYCLCEEKSEYYDWRS